MEKVFIYTLEDPTTNQIRYVGKANNVEKRFKDHLNSSRDKGTHKRNWINKLKSGGLKPIIKVIDEVPLNNWQFWEQYWYYQLLSWGYKLLNYTTCGEGLTFGNQTSFKLGHSAKKVVALNLDGTFNSEYNSILNASLINNISNSNISSVLSKKTKSAGKLIWLYYDEYINLLEDDINKIILNVKDTGKKGGKETRFEEGHTPWNKGLNFTRPGKTVYQYDKNMNLIAEYESCAEAARVINGNQDSISNCCRGKSKSSANFIWKYEKIINNE